MLESLLAEYEHECWCEYNDEYVGEDGKWHDKEEEE